MWSSTSRPPASAQHLVVELLERRAGAEQAQPRADARDVGVDRHVGQPEGEQQHAGGGLAPDAGQGGQVARASATGSSPRERGPAGRAVRAGSPGSARTSGGAGRRAGSPPRPPPAARRGPPPRRGSARAGAGRRRRGCGRWSTARGRSGSAPRAPCRAAARPAGRRRAAAGRGARAPSAARAATTRRAGRWRPWRSQEAAYARRIPRRRVAVRLASVPRRERSHTWGRAPARGPGGGTVERANRGEPSEVSECVQRCSLAVP